MSPINLINYTRSSKKISHQVLATNKTNIEAKAWRILLSLLIDFYATLSLTFTMSFFMKIRFMDFMITKKLLDAQLDQGDELVLMVFPVVLLGYFFFSTFFNHGQTLGMHTMKLRVEMAAQSFKQSLIWATYSLSVYMTLGLTFLIGRHWMDRQGLGKVVVHDYLYRSFMEVRDYSPVSILKLSKENSELTKVSAESFSQAA